MNVKEQGRLLRQNEFLVWQGKGKKCLRQVFLFEDLILFSKARRFPDRKVRQLFNLLYVVCRSARCTIYKWWVACFFRTSIFTSISTASKRRTSGWPPWSRTHLRSSRFGSARGNQATRTRCSVQARTLRKPGRRNWATFYGNRRCETEVRYVLKYSFLQPCLRADLTRTPFVMTEVRLAEMSSMGIGNKPCLDIRPSADQINDRSISVAQLSKSKYTIDYFEWNDLSWL